MTLRTAMVLAAGLGTRMRPITLTTPKPLVTVAGRTLLDWTLDAAVAAGVETAIVNVHHLADPIEAHVAARTAPRVLVSDERAGLLDSAGGVVKALPMLGDNPFLILNADTFWIDAGANSLRALFNAWDDDAMDWALLLADPVRSTGHSGTIDFLRDAHGRLSRAPKGAAETDGYIYAGAAVVHPRVFAGAGPTPHSLNRYFDRAIEAGRLFGFVLDGHWITVGTPDAIGAAEQAVRAAQGASD